jgi:hypothetical protein
LFPRLGGTPPAARALLPETLQQCLKRAFTNDIDLKFGFATYTDRGCPSITYRFRIFLFRFLNGATQIVDVHYWDFNERPVQDLKDWSYRYRAWDIRDVDCRAAAVIQALLDLIKRESGRDYWQVLFELKRQDAAFENEFNDAAHRGKLNGFLRDSVRFLRLGRDEHLDRALKPVAEVRSGNSCVICHGGFGVGKNDCCGSPVTLDCPCTGAFGRACVEDWLMAHFRCPYCSAELP